MTIIKLSPDHNNTTECFKRHSKVFYSDRFISEASIKKRWQRADWWLLTYLAVLLLIVLFLPSLPAEPLSQQSAVVGAPMTVKEKTQLISFKACPPGLAPLWIDSTTIQCFRELP